jgi:MYXO-CTERM domain-containing protein
VDAGDLDGGLDGGAVDGGGVDAGSVDAGVDAGFDGGPSGPVLGVGVIAFIPPDGHEFGHNLGFMDLYGGPIITGLMGNPRSGLSAHSRVAIGWGEEQVIDEPVEDLTLAPVLEGGPVLRFGEPPRYVLVENRSGFKHNQTEIDYPGLYFYTIDENELPDGELGFLDLLNGDLFLPNAPDPKVGNIDCIDDCYLNVNMPLECRFVPPEEGSSCTLAGEGARRNVEHAMDGHLGYYVEILERDFDGTMHIAIREGDVADLVPPDAGTANDDAGPAGDGGDVPPGDDCACSETSGGAAAPFWLALFMLGAALRRRR